MKPFAEPPSLSQHTLRVHSFDYHTEPHRTLAHTLAKQRSPLTFPIPNLPLSPNQTPLTRLPSASFAHLNHTHLNTHFTR